MYRLEGLHRSAVLSQGEIGLKVGDVLVTLGRLRRGVRDDLPRKPSIPRGSGIRKPLY